MTKNLPSNPSQRPPIRYQVGDRVVITETTMEGMRAKSRNRTGSGWIADHFIEKVEKLVGIEGKVTQTFPPGYQMVVEIEGQLFSMRDDFVEPVRH